MHAHLLGSDSPSEEAVALVVNAPLITGSILIPHPTRPSTGNLEHQCQNSPRSKCVNDEWTREVISLCPPCDSVNEAGNVKSVERDLEKCCLSSVLFLWYFQTKAQSVFRSIVVEPKGGCLLPPVIPLFQAGLHPCFLRSGLLSACEGHTGWAVRAVPVH